MGTFNSHQRETQPATSSQKWTSAVNGTIWSNICKQGLDESKLSTLAMITKGVIRVKYGLQFYEKKSLKN